MAASPTPYVFLGWQNLCPSLQVVASEATSEHDQPCLPLSGAAFVLESLLPSQATLIRLASWKRTFHLSTPDNSCAIRAVACPSLNCSKPRAIHCTGLKTTQERDVHPSTAPKWELHKCHTCLLSEPKKTEWSLVKPDVLFLVIIYTQAGNGYQGNLAPSLRIWSRSRESLWHIGVVFLDSPGRG